MIPNLITWLTVWYVNAEKENNIIIIHPLQKNPVRIFNKLVYSRQKTDWFVAINPDACAFLPIWFWRLLKKLYPNSLHFWSNQRNPCWSLDFLSKMGQRFRSFDLVSTLAFYKCNNFHFFPNIVFRNCERYVYLTWIRDNEFMYHKKTMNYFRKLYQKYSKYLLS